LKKNTGGPKRLLDAAAWHYFASYYREQYPSLFLFAIVAATQAILVLPVLMLVRRIFDVALPGRHVAQIVLIGAGIFLLRTLNAAITLWIRAKQIKTFKSAISRMREDLLFRLYTFSRRFYTRLDRNTTHTRIVQDTERLDDVSNALMSRVLPALLTSFALVIVLLFLNWFLLLIMLSLTPLLLLGLRLTGRRVKERVFVFQRAFETFSKGTMFVLHHLDLIYIQSCGTEDAISRTQQVQHLRRTGVRMAFIYALHGQLKNIVTGFCGVIILTVGAVSVAAHFMTLGQLLSFWVAAGLLNGYARTIIETIPQIVAGNESMVTLYQLMNEGEPAPYSGQSHINFSGEIEMRDVVFGFDQRPVLKGLCLRIGPGANLAIVGPNGAGKSTLAWLILGAYRPREGVILADGIPYDEIDMVKFRRSIGTVTQHPEFFPGSIAENIGYGSDHAGLDEIKRAARIALIHEFIETLPDGYDTQVGERGVLLAGGEAQRLAIARALLRRPRLLILDEPTNHLDRNAIGRLMKQLQTLENRPAILTISHDREVVDFADEIYALRNGIAVSQPAAALSALETA
jgi:ATP-binding cassette, subfamily B, bacterial